MSRYFIEAVSPKLWPTFAFWLLIQLCPTFQDGSRGGCLDGERPPRRGDATLPLPAPQVPSQLSLSHFHFLIFTFTLSLLHFHFSTFTFTLSLPHFHLNVEKPHYLYQRLGPFPKQCLIKSCRWAKKGVTDEGSWMFCFEMQKEIFVQVKLICKCAQLKNYAKSWQLSLRSLIKTACPN